MNLRPRDRIISNVELADKLCGDSSDLRAAHAHHLGLHGNLIPHVFMGEVLARAGACILPGMANAPSGRAELSRIVETLEHAMAGGDRETCNVIYLSFVRDAEAEPFFAALRPMLGPRLGALTQPQPAGA